MGSKISTEDKEMSVHLLSHISSMAEELIPSVASLTKKIINKDLNVAKGDSFLCVKNQLLLDYMIQLTHLMHQKVSGQSIENAKSVDKLIEIRTVLEKMRPIEQKLKYELDKKINIATAGVLAENDPIRFKPNLGNLVSKLDDDGGDASDGGPEDDQQLYRPSKFMPKYYDADDTVRQKRERLLEKAKKRVMNSALMKDLQREYTDGPEEITDNVNIHRVKEDRREHEKKEYEEEYFIRMQVTKKEKMAARQMRTMSNLGDITKFADVGLLTGENPDSNEFSKKKRKKSSSGKKKGFKKRKKFH